MRISGPIAVQKLGYPPMRMPLVQAHLAAKHLAADNFARTLSDAPIGDAAQLTLFIAQTMRSDRRTDRATALAYQQPDDEAPLFSIRA